MDKVNTGIGAEDRKRMAESLSRALADSYTLYLKTHNYHWNVEGPHFKALHDLFEEQYTDLATAVDDIAERIRALGHYAPGSYKEFAELAAIQEDAQKPDWQTMLRRLSEDQETVVQTFKQAVKTAQEIEDISSEDLLTQRVRTHEKNAWMLRAHLE
jgi:starvation-inducible DNA-binding protein